jgi:Iron-containing redox enzyme
VTTSVASLSHSALLRAKIRVVLPEMNSAAHALWDHPRLGEVYPRFLGMMHGVIRSSVPLMEAALARAQGLAHHDPVAAGMLPYLIKHIPEEHGHDDWLLEDMQVLGIDAADVLRQPPSPLVAELVGAQYYWINHFHPVALLGYIAVIEGYPPEVEAVHELVARSGHPKAAFRTFIRHAHLDPRHKADVDRLIDTLPLEQKHVSVMGVSALRTVLHFGQVMEQVLN